MPLINYQPGVGVPAVSDYDAPDPSFLETLGAAFRQDNIIGSAATLVRNNMDAGNVSAVDPSYNIYDDADMADYLKENPALGETIFSKPAADAKRAQIDQERKDKQTLEASGWTGVGLSMVASVADPTILLPGGALARSGRVGYSVARSAAAVGVAAGAGAAVQEAALQGTQETRTAGETTMAVGGSVILGGIIGGAASRLFSGAEWSRVSKQLEADLADDVPDPTDVTRTIVQRMQSAGAAASDDIDMSDLGIGGPRAADLVARATAAARINPGVQTMLSPSVKVRETYGRLVDNPIYTTMNMEGRSLGADVENSVKLYERGAVAKWLRSSSDLYRKARKEGFAGSRAKFNKAVAYAGRRGDTDVNGNQYVTQAAQEARAVVFDPLLARAKELELLPEDVKTTTAASYVTRLWNRQRLIGEEERFRRIARDYFSRELDRIDQARKLADKAEQAAKADPNAKAKVKAAKAGKDIPEFVSAEDRADYIEEIVSSVFNNLTGRGVGDVPEWLVPITRGPLKDRVFNIADEQVEDFLENDMELVLRRYARTMGAEVELAQKFGRADMRDQLEEITAEYDALRKAAKTPEERLKLDAAEKRDMTNLKAFRDMIRGTYRASDEGTSWSKITRTALTFNYVRLMGGVLLTSITDTANIIGKHGVRAAMREGLPALVKGTKAAKLSRQEAQDLGVVVDRVLQSRLATLSELQDPYRMGSPYERFLSNASNLFSKATGLALWNDTLRTVSAVMTQNRILRNITEATSGNAIDFAKLDKYERAYMGFLGVDEQMAARISSQFQRYGIDDGGIKGANSSQWDDEVARRAWAAALNKDVDRTIIVKGVADNPLWMKTNTGKLIAQFKSFALATHQRILIAGLQERPHRLLEATAWATGMGMLISYLKYAERGDMEEANKLLENPGLWVANGLDRSGILAIPFEISNTLEKWGSPVGITKGISALAGDEDQSGGASRYASRGKLGAVLGPSAGMFEDLLEIARQMSEGDITKSGANAIIRQIPGGTLPGIRSALQMGVKPALADAVQ